jgi:hypothetical protein
VDPLDVGVVTGTVTGAAVAADSAGAVEAVAIWAAAPAEIVSKEEAEVARGRWWRGWSRHGKLASREERSFPIGGRRKAVVVDGSGSKTGGRAGTAGRRKPEVFKGFE